jgi:hypothetical protein
LGTSAQSFTLKTAANVIVNDGDTVVVSGLSTGNDLFSTLHLQNNAAVSKSIKIERTILSLVNGCENAFAFGFFMYPPSINITPVGFTVDAGVIDSSFWTSYWHYGIAGTSFIRFNFFDENNTGDAISVVFKFEISQATSLNNLSDKNGISVYPGITSDYVFINCEKCKSTKFTLVSTQGKVVQKWNLTEGQTKVQLSQFPNGMYFIIAESINGSTSVVIKLIKQE